MNGFIAEFSLLLKKVVYHVSDGGCPIGEVHHLDWRMLLRKQLEDELRD